MNMKRKSFSLVLLLLLAALVLFSGCQAEREESENKWEPGVTEFTNDGVTYYVVKRFLDENTPITVVVGDQGVSFARVSLDTGTFSNTFVPYDGGDISYNESTDPDLPWKEVYREALEAAGYPVE